MWRRRLASCWPPCQHLCTGNERRPHPHHPGHHPQFDQSFFAELANCIVKELARGNYKTMLCITDGDPSLEQDLVFMAEQHRVNGIIGLSYNPKLQVPDEKMAL